jgi:hypothetical protein
MDRIVNRADSTPWASPVFFMMGPLEFKISGRTIDIMWVIFLEAGIALALFLFIIWWTMRGKR